MFGKKKEVKKEPVSSPSTGRVQRMVPELATLPEIVSTSRMLFMYPKARNWQQIKRPEY